MFSDFAPNDRKSAKANFIPRMVAIATKFEVNGTYGYTKKRPEGRFK